MQLWLMKPGWSVTGCGRLIEGAETDWAEVVDGAKKTQRTEKMKQLNTGITKHQ